MLDPIKEIYKYVRVFEKFLGKRIYLIFFLGLIAALSEGIGILMLLPLLESLGGNIQESELNSFSRYLFTLIESFAFYDPIPIIIILITVLFFLKVIMRSWFLPSKD